MAMRFKYRLLICAGLVWACAAAASAQTGKESIEIFATKGRINHASGSSQVHRVNDGPRKILAVGDDLTVGDIVETGADSHLEILLNPGSYFRVTDNTQFQIVSSSAEGMRIFVRRGSAIVENGNSPYQSFSIQVLTPLGMAFFENPGIYRVNVRLDGSEYISLFGNFALGSRKVNLSGGQRVTVNGVGAGPIADYDAKAAQDPFETWSRTRAEVLAKANRKLNSRKLGAAMQSAASDESLVAALQDQPGLWAHCGVNGFSVFVPFYPGYWRSPYGFGYTNGNDRFELTNNNANVRVNTKWPGRVSSGVPQSQEAVKPRGIRVTNPQ